MWKICNLFKCNLKEKEEEDPYIHALYESLRIILNMHMQIKEGITKDNNGKPSLYQKGYLAGLSYAFEQIKKQIYIADLKEEKYIAELEEKI